MSDKKQRGKNFSAEEELLLVDLVANKKHILENKKSDTVNWRLKNDTWMELEESFKSQSGVYRPWKALRDKYENIKRKAKMELANEKLETYRTGGGTSSNGLVSAVSEKILSLVGNAATGLQNTFDNDANNNNIQDDDDTMEEEYLDYMDKVNSNWMLQEDFPNIIEEASEQKDQEKPKSTTEPCLAGVKSTVKRKISKELFIPNKNKKRSMEEEKVKFLKSQQAFYDGENSRAAERHKLENSRAAERHKLEIEGMQLKNQILALELKEKQAKCDLYNM